MKNYPYTKKTGALKKYLESLPSIGKPSKITQQHLESLGYKSTNDRPIITILKFLKFTDDSGNSTKKLGDYRNRSTSKKVLGGAIKDSYKELFDTYPDAEKKDTETLKNFFSTKTGTADQVSRAMVDTFKALCSISDLQGGEELIQATENSSESLTPENPADSNYHNISFALLNGKKIKIILPIEITLKDIEKLKKLLDALIFIDESGDLP